MDEISSVLASELGIKGTANIQFGYEEHTERLLVLEIKPSLFTFECLRCSRNRDQSGPGRGKVRSRCFIKRANLDSIPAPETTAVRIPFSSSTSLRVLTAGSIQGCSQRELR
jgi:hypothetical protein